MKSVFRTSAHVALYVSATIGGVLFVAGAQPTQAQNMDQRMRDLESRMRELPHIDMSNLPDGFIGFRTNNRAVIGLMLSTSGRADTLGLLVEDVTKGGPADKAGIHEGARITDINGVSLRIASADANDPDMQGIGQRRLQREMNKAKPGDEIELRLVESGKVQTVKVKTVSASDLSPNRIPMTMSAARESMEKRASLGVSIGVSGSVRDTLGLFINSVTTNGPAEKAGVVEGDRIAAINGIDVRVPKEDAEDAQASSARMNRFMRELGKSAPGDKITLRVYSGGRYHEVQVTAGSGSDMGGSGFRINFGDGPSVISLPRSNGGSIIRSVPGRSIIRTVPEGPASRAVPIRSVIRRVMTSV
ncbi:MAG: PDZ domain-containing protein [Gemmatimonadaceae bacterium]